MDAIREPAVAGYFYPGTADELAVTVSALLGAAGHDTGPAADTPPKALIVPHAGYVYSGPTAAAGYARLLPWRDRYRRVVVADLLHGFRQIGSRSRVTDCIHSDTCTES